MDSFHTLCIVSGAHINHFTMHISPADKLTSWSHVYSTLLQYYCDMRTKRTVCSLHTCRNFYGNISVVILYTVWLPCRYHSNIGIILLIIPHLLSKWQTLKMKYCPHCQLLVDSFSILCVHWLKKFRRWYVHDDLPFYCKLNQQRY